MKIRVTFMHGELKHAFILKIKEDFSAYTNALIQSLGLFVA